MAEISRDGRRAGARRLRQRAALVRLEVARARARAACSTTSCSRTADRRCSRSRSSRCASSTGTHEIYQLSSARRSDELRGDEIEQAAADRLRGLADAVRRASSSALMRGRRLAAGREGTIEFCGSSRAAGRRAAAPEARAIGAEQSNTSVVFDDALILKVFRRLEAGINPELEMLRFLDAHGFANIAAARAAGTRTRAGRSTRRSGSCRATSRTRGDGWELALDALAERPATSSSRRLRRLGEVTGAMHSVLASDPDDPDFAPEEPSVEALGAAHGDGRRADRARLPRRCPRTSRRSRRSAAAARRCATSCACSRTRVAAGAADPHARRLPPRPDAAGPATTGSSSTSRASRRARSPSGAASARRCATSPACCARSPTRARAARCCAAPTPPDELGGAAREQFLDGYLRDGRPAAAAGRRAGRSSGCSPCSSSRRRSTSCATSSTTGPTGSGSRSRGIERLLESRACRDRRERRSSGSRAASTPTRTRPRRAPGERRRASSARSGPRRAAVRVQPRRGRAVELRRIHPAGLFEATLRGRDAAARYELEVDYPDGDAFALRDPYALPADARRARPAPRRRGPPRGALRAARRAPARARRRRRAPRSPSGRRTPRSVSRRRRLQRLGRAAAPDALARRRPASGSCSSRASERRALQVRDPHARRARCA